MKYDLKNRKLRELWLSAYRNGYNVDKEVLKNLIIEHKSLKQEKTHIKNIYNFSTDWEEVVVWTNPITGTKSSWFGKQWEIIFNPFPISYISYIYSMPVFQYTDMEEIDVSTIHEDIRTEEIIQLEDIYNDDGTISTTIAKVRLVRHIEFDVFSSINNTFNVKLVVKVYNPDSYV